MSLKYFLFSHSLYRSGTVNDVVKIGGVNCVISSTTNTQIVCATDQAPNSMKTKVSVEIDGNGVAKQVCIILCLGCPGFNSWSNQQIKIKTSYNYNSLVY